MKSPTGSRTFGVPAAERLWQRMMISLSLVLPALGLTPPLPVDVMKRDALQSPVPRGVTVNPVAADRTTLRMLRQADELSRQEEPPFDKILQLLQRVVDQPTDGMFAPDPNRPDERVSVRQTAQTQLLSLPPAGRQLYDLHHAAEAKELFELGLRKQDEQPLHRAVRRFFMTPAGQDAAYFIASLRMEQGEPHGAARALEQLKTLPEQERRRWEPKLTQRLLHAYLAGGDVAAAQDLAESVPTLDRVTLGGRTFAIDREELAASLRRLAEEFRAEVPPISGEWRMAWGGPGRLGMARWPTSHGRQQWSRETLSDPNPFHDPFDPTPSAALRELRKIAAKANATLPPGRSVTRSGRVVYCTPTNLTAVSAIDGRTLWETPTLRQLWDWHAANDGRWSSGAMHRLTADRPRHQFVIVGGQVIVVESDSPFLSPSPAQPGSNRLVAYDLETGRINWEVGGSPQDGYTPSLPGSYFCCSPVPSATTLYILAGGGTPGAGGSGQIELLVLNAGTGELQWRQPIGEIPQDSQLPGLYAHAIGCAVGGGLVICPVGNLLVAVDISNRSFSWVKETKVSETEENGFQRGVVAVAGNRCLYGRTGSNTFRCCDLSSGDELWRTKQTQPIYLGVRKTDVIISHPNGLLSLSLRDGSPTWECQLPAKVTGQGVLFEDRAVVPIVDRLAVVELQQGRLLRAVPVPEKMDSGNLVPVPGGLLLQSIDRLGFLPAEELE